MILQLCEFFFKKRGGLVYKNGSNLFFKEVKLKSCRCYIIKKNRQKIKENNSNIYPISDKTET